MTNTELLSRWIELHQEKWGVDVSSEKMFNNILEESAELIVAMQHYKRKRVPFSDVRIEMADVMICIASVLLIEDPDGPPITDDIKEISQRQIDILEGRRPRIHNDGEEEIEIP